MKKIKVPLSVSGLKELQAKINELNTDLKKSCDNITKELSDIAQKEIQKNYSASYYTDGNDDCEQFKEKIEDGYKVGVKGSQVLYREFGTGTEGLNKPHPMKNNFNLNDYNSGKKIREAKITTNINKGVLLGEKYWTYKNSNGEIIVTQGIPAGKEVFDASLILKKEKQNIIKKEVGGILSKL